VGIRDRIAHAIILACAVRGWVGRVSLGCGSGIAKEVVFGCWLGHKVEKFSDEHAERAGNHKPEQFGVSQGGSILGVYGYPDSKSRQSPRQRPEGQSSRRRCLWTGFQFVAHAVILAWGAFRLRSEEPLPDGVHEPSDWSAGIADFV
jgi:hypothetical protein